MGFGPLRNRRRPRHALLRLRTLGNLLCRDGELGGGCVGGVGFTYPTPGPGPGPGPGVARAHAPITSSLGADVAVFRESGLLLIPKQDHFFAYLVRPDSADARRGLRSGDWIEGMVSAETIAKTLREGQELSVIRYSNGVGVDTVLEAVEAPTAVSAPPQNP